MAKAPKKRHGERGPDKKPRKGSPRVGKAGPIGTDERPTREVLRSLLALFVAKIPINEIAKRTGIGRTTVYKWLSDPEIQAELKVANDQGIALALSMLQSDMVDSVETVRKLRGRSTLKDRVKLEAAWGTLDRGGIPVVKRIEVKDDRELSDDERAKKVADLLAKAHAAKEAGGT